MKKVINLYKALGSGEKLLPTVTGFAWWEAAYTANGTALDREFVRRYRNFKYFDFLEEEGTTDAESLTDFRADVLSILTLNQKKYSELYRIYVSVLLVAFSSACLGAFLGSSFFSAGFFSSFLG